MTTLYIFTSLIIVFVISALWLATYLFRRAKDLAPYYAEKETLEQDIATAKQNRAQMLLEMEQLTADYAQAKQDIADAECQRKWLQDNQGTVSSLKGQIASTQQELEDVTGKLDKIKTELQDKNQELKDITNESNAKELEKRSAEHELGELQHKIQTAQNSLAANEDKLQKLVKDIAQRDLDLAERIHNLSEAEKRLSSAESQIRELSNDIASLKKEKEEFEAYAKLKKEAQADLEKLEKTLHQLETAIEDKSKSLSSIEDKLFNLEKELAQKAGVVSSLDRKATELQESIRKKEKNKASLESEIAQLTETRNGVKARVSELEYELSGLVGKEKAQEKKWEDLDRPVKTINIAKPKEHDERDWLAEFEDNLATTGFRFDTRLIKAFHTSLKVADCSPMVVLSGISGTGKSLLPELYAHAVGMNFLQVPVQPRWDSPQDMLGFYNYMEHRYKATELSRLLWQSDKFNNPAQAKNNPAMNLILLDEMNLARVEYYFSDMLSKLEVRRGIDPTNEMKRRAAEIVLESGATGGVEDIRHIFVGTNNLFIGTMNEDESTQSLSDKVKDRANVLRFGRPKELSGAAANKEEFFKKYTSCMMTEAMWKKWISTSEDRGISNLGQQMDEINRYLAELGRPFAHRMWNTVAAYISQYPGDKHDALIDQIEMKILPKLTGLDMADPTINRVMSNLAGYLHKLNEPRLNEAFDLACKRDFFAWQGIEC